MKRLFHFLIFILIIGVWSFFVPPVEASCNLKYIGSVPTGPSPPNPLQERICSIDAGTVEGADIAANEASTTNTSVIMLMSTSITINASGATLAAGSVISTDGTSSLNIAGGSYLGGNGLWIDDADADGWALTDFTLYAATASARRRLGLMRSVTTADCSDTTYNTGNTCSYGDGADGAVTISTYKNINTDTIASGRSYADGIAYRVTAPADSATSVSRDSVNDTISNGIAAGDDVLLINLQGTTTDFADVGNYEIMTVSAVSASTITFTTAITKSFNGTSAANQKVIIQRVPNYTNFTVDNTINFGTSGWDGLTTTPTGTAGYHSGIIALRATGTVTVNGVINANGMGYRGGARGDATYTFGRGGEAFCGLGGSTAGGSGAAGAGHNTASGVGGAGSCGGGGGSFNTTTAGAGSASSGGSGGGGANVGGGGGGGYGSIGYRGHDESNGTSGTDGGTNASGNGGKGATIRGGGGGGGTFGSSTLTTFLLGVGGGGGGRATIYNGGTGGNGGGIVYISAATVTLNSAIAIASNGASGEAGGAVTAGGGGGGSGGSIYIKSDNILSSPPVLITGGTGSLTGNDGGNGGSGRSYYTQ